MEEEKRKMMSSNIRVKALCIISSKNQTGTQACNQSVEDLIRYLKIGNYAYLEVEDLCSDSGGTIVIFNISLNNALGLCGSFNQLPVSYIDIDGTDVNYQCWESDDTVPKVKLKLKYKVHETIDAVDAKDFWTQISNIFKLGFPCYDAVANIDYLISKNCPDSRRADKLIDECLTDKFTGKHQYVNRFKLYGKAKSRTSKIQQVNLFESRKGESTDE